LFALKNNRNGTADVGSAHRNEDHRLNNNADFQHMKNLRIQTIINNINVSENMKQSKKREKGVFSHLQSSAEKCIVMSTIEMLKKEAERLDR
jgi:hypothetical protein